eukprot:413538_1
MYMKPSILWLHNVYLVVLIILSMMPAGQKSLVKVTLFGSLLVLSISFCVKCYYRSKEKSRDRKRSRSAGSNQPLLPRTSDDITISEVEEDDEKTEEEVVAVLDDQSIRDLQRKLAKLKESLDRRDAQLTSSRNNSKILKNRLKQKEDRMNKLLLELGASDRTAASTLRSFQDRKSVIAKLKLNMEIKNGKVGRGGSTDSALKQKEDEIVGLSKTVHSLQMRRVNQSLILSRELTELRQNYVELKAKYKSVLAEKAVSTLRRASKSAAAAAAKSAASTTEEPGITESEPSSFVSLETPESAPVMPSEPRSPSGLECPEETVPPSEHSVSLEDTVEKMEDEEAPAEPDVSQAPSTSVPAESDVSQAPPESDVSALKMTRRSNPTDQPSISMFDYLQEPPAPAEDGTVSEPEAERVSEPGAGKPHGTHVRRGSDLNRLSNSFRRQQKLRRSRMQSAQSTRDALPRSHSSENLTDLKKRKLASIVRFDQPTSRSAASPSSRKESKMKKNALVHFTDDRDDDQFWEDVIFSPLEQGVASHGFSLEHALGDVSSLATAVSPTSTTSLTTSSLFESLVISHDDVLSMLETCSSEEFVRNFGIICASIYSTPPWLNWHSRMAMQIIRKRVINNIYIQQSVDFSKMSNPSQLSFIHRLRSLDHGRKFFHTILRSKRKVGFEIRVPLALVVFHPFKEIRISKVSVEKLFKSNTRPLLLKLYDEEGNGLDEVILKYGDDLRNDMAALSMFRLFNFIWAAENEGKYNIQARFYDCVSIGTDLGIIEYVPDTIPIQSVTTPPDSAEKLDLSIGSGAGGLVASFVLGIKDRHDDNTLLEGDGTMFHIDFGYILGAKVSIDTDEIAVTKGTKKYFGREGWAEFVKTTVIAFGILRRHRLEILRFAQMILGQLFPPEVIEVYFKRSFMLHLSEDAALRQMENMIKKAPGSYRTRFKNVLHHTAQALK